MARTGTPGYLAVGEFVIFLTLSLHPYWNAY